MVFRRFPVVVSLLSGCLVAAASLARADEVVPPGVVRSLEAGERLQLVSVLDAGTPVRPGGWNLRQTAVAPADRTLGVKLGRDALALTGESPNNSGKGDFVVEAALPGDVRAIGCWVYAAEPSNVGQVGFQFYDAEGEALLVLTPATWTGWKWVETTLAAESLKQAYPQKDKNGRADQPLKGVNLIWWTKTAGKSELVVDALVARVKASDDDRARGVSVSVAGASDSPRDQKYGGSLLLSNATDRATKVEIELSLQRDGRLDERPLPDPGRGTDLARSSKSWSVIEGKRIDDGTLTDGLDFTATETPYRGKHWESADQFVELPNETEVTALGWRSGDANWIWKVDVSASTDGVNFTPVADLQNVDLHARWQRQEFPTFKPFRAKVVKFHYHNNGEKSDAIRMPAAIFVWNGVADESLELPKIGEEVQRLTFARDAAPGAFDVIDYEFQTPLATGQYALVSRVKTGETVTIQSKPVFVEPAWLENVGPDSKFGLNASTPSLANELRKLGIGWVRFENFKWPMVSARPHEFDFTGGTGPWHLNFDEITRGYREAGLNVLPMMFMTPEWAARPDDKVQENMKLSQPPKDDADFGEFAFQSAARYGSTKVDAAKLKTKDGVSGLDRIHYFELGNEPDLNPLRDPSRPPSWGPWAGTMDQWWAMWEHGARAIREADPRAKLNSPGFAGSTVETVDALRVRKTADGKSYLDLVDVVSVHYYSGRVPPEIATGDVNNSKGSEVKFVEHLKRLDEWRDKHKPSAKIWMTETGYDAGGPIGTNEWFQAARLPRVVALCLAHGVEKVFVYRESGSDPTRHAGAGVVRNDHSRRPSWYTYATLIRQLQDASPVARLPHENPNVWIQRWDRKGETLLMVHAITGEATLDLELGPTTVVDAFGGETRVESTRGLALNEFPLYLSKITSEAALEPLARAAADREKARVEARERDARRKFHAYAFGAPTEPLAIDLGGPRYFTVVKADSLHTPETKLGFVGGPATRNDFRHWMKSPLEKHSVEFGAGQSCRFDEIAAGRYELRINAEPLAGGRGTISVEGIEGGPLTLSFSGGEQTAARAVRLTGAPLVIKSESRLLLRWLTLEEVFDGE